MNYVTDPSQKIASEALNTVAQDYGDAMYGAGHPVSKLWLPYHNYTHSRETRQRALLMAERLGLSAVDQAVVSMAAAAHDIVQEGGRGEMEAASADWLERAMRERGFDPAQIDAGRLAILGTEPVQMGQRVSELEFPSLRAELIAQAVAAGDMGSLFSPASPLQSHAIYQEQVIKQDLSRTYRFGNDAPSLDGLLDFQRQTLAFTEGFEFAHPEAENLFGAGRAAVTAYHRHLVNQIEAGNVTDWDHLRWQDMSFRDDLKAELC